MTVRFTERETALMREALARWGLAAQAGQTVEECAELIVALQKHTNRAPSAHTAALVADELADVEIMLAQMRMALGIDDESFRARMAAKFEKLADYLRRDTENA
jgi:NTP pyrophosphatase (non-canonical NTP hydrolase)